MLRRLKAQVTQVANELPDLLANSSRDGSMDGEREGFLCPICMTPFPSPEQLSLHFDSHENGVSGLSVENPNFGMDDTTVNNSSLLDTALKPQFLTKDKEIEELRQQLKDEKWFSEEIKKELDRIHAVVASSQDVPQEEVPYLMQQIQMLEAGKSMVTQRLLEIEKENNGLRRSLEGAAQEKREVMGRLKQLTERIRQLTEENEEKKTENTMMCEDLKKLKKEVEKLNQALDQRPSEDDVAVLRTELVNAQHLMDEISQHKDVEIKEHIDSIRMLSAEREKQHCMLENLHKQMSVSGETTKQTSMQIASLSSEVSELKILSDTQKMEIDILKKDVVSKEKTIEETETRLSSSLKELSDCHIKVSQLEAAVLTSGRSIDDSHRLNEMNMVKLGQLNEKLEQMIEEKKKYEADLCNFEEKIQKQSYSIRSLEMANMELTNELSSMGSLLDKERSLLKEKDNLIDQKGKLLDELKDQLDTAVKNTALKAEEVSDKDKLVEALQKEVITLKENSKELLEKISAGEGGAKMAIDQMNEEKRKLLDDIKILGDSLKEQKVNWESKVTELEKKLKESERHLAEMRRKGENEVEDLQRRLREADDEINRKAEHFVEMEKESEEERRKTTERITKVKELLQLRDVAAIEMRKQIEQLSSEVSDRDITIRDRERALDDSRKQVELSLKTIKQAGEKARALESELQRVESERNVLSDTESDLREKLKEINMHVKECEETIVKLKDDVKEKDEGIQELQREQAEKHEHWRAKISTLESQMEENHKANDELMNNVKEFSSQVNYLKEEVEIKQMKIENETSRADELCCRINDLESILQKEKDEKEQIEQRVQSNLLEFENLQRHSIQLSAKLVEEGSRVQKLERDAEQRRKENEIENMRTDERIAELETLLMETQQRVSTLQQNVEDKEKELAKLSEIRDKMAQTCSEKDAELEEFKIRVIQFEEQMSCEMRKMDQLESEKSQHHKEVQRTRKKIEELNKNHAAQIGSLNSTLEEMRTECSEKQLLFDKLSARCTVLESQLVHERDESRIEVERRDEKLEALQHKLSDLEEVSMETNTKLREENESIRRSLESVKSEMEERNIQLEHNLKKIEELTANNAELSQQIGSWEEEKNALIERCLNTESDLDFERERAMENKRRFDDALSAMHELGRANQSLQMDISKQTTRKWLDDNEAVNCTSCGKVFSLTVRKHHCRVCGMIFCSPCSSHTVKIASNKNPVRVCAPCMQEVCNR